MTTNDEGTTQQPQPWFEVAPPVRDMVLARFRVIIGEVQVLIADNVVTHILRQQAVAAAMKAAALRGQMGEELSDVMEQSSQAAQEAFSMSEGAEDAVLVSALISAYAHLNQPVPSRNVAQNAGSAPNGNWPELCCELSLDPSTASPSDVLQMVRRLKARAI